MKPRYVFATLVIVLAWRSSAGAAVSAAVLRESDLVFDGRVARTSGITVPGAPADAPLAAIEVERVIAKPDAASLKPGDTVMVSVSDPIPEIGSRARFYTAAWSYGDVIAVHERAREPVPVFGASEVASIQTRLREAKLDAFVDAADAVLVGLVTSVSTPSAEAQFVTEHDPLWREAVVRVQSWIKGGTGRSVKVRFPASIDVVWSRVPKLQEGMTQTFLLHAEPSALTGQDQTLVPTYRIKSPLDVLPVSDAPVVRKLAQQ